MCRHNLFKPDGDRFSERENESVEDSWTRPIRRGQFRGKCQGFVKEMLPPSRTGAQSQLPWQLRVLIITAVQNYKTPINYSRTLKQEVLPARQCQSTMFFVIYKHLKILNLLKIIKTLLK